MGTAASIPTSVDDALKAGYTQEQIDAYQKTAKESAAAATDAGSGATAATAATAATTAAAASTDALPSESPEFVKRVKALFAYIDASLDERNEDGYITTEELVLFFGETSKEADAEKNAAYWLKEIDGFGDNTGFITLDEMMNYFDSLDMEDAVEALENLESYEGYDAAGNDIRTQSPEFRARVEDLFRYIDESIDERNEDGYITTAELIAFFGETSKKSDAIRNARYWLKEIDGYGDNTGFITLDEMMQYFNSLSTDDAVEALENLEAYEDYDRAAAPTREYPSKSPEFVKRVKALFKYIDDSIDDRNEDGYITTKELVAFFGETAKKGDAVRTATYWLKQMDGYGDNSGYITISEMMEYFDSLDMADAIAALETLESYAGYDAMGNDIRTQSPEFRARVEELFRYIDESIDERNEDGYITTEELVAFFGETKRQDAEHNATYWLNEIDGYGDNSGTITLDEMLDYFNSLKADDAIEALESLEAYEGYEPGTIHVNDEGVETMDI